MFVNLKNEIYFDILIVKQSQTAIFWFKFLFEALSKTH